jgi:hypothetical protein
VSSTSALDIRRFIDDRPVSRYQLLVAVMCGLIVFVDGFDAQAMGYVAPALTTAMKISRGVLASVISSGLVGMMIGALVSGPLADRIGRKPVLIGCSLIFGIGSLLTTTAQSVESLMAWRAITGLGMGGAMPNAIALTSEYMAPSRRRRDDDDLRVLVRCRGRRSRCGLDHPGLRMAIRLHRRWDHSDRDRVGVVCLFAGIDPLSARSRWL